MHIASIIQLEKHISYIKSLYDLGDFFIVGGAVRDVLLGKKGYILDVDITMQWDPNNIRQIISSKKIEGIDIFRTEKFGTMTMIISANQLYPWAEGKIKYEITPLREESGYEDYRHPDKITRSDSLLLDASRRDFTVNAIYYFSFTKDIWLEDNLDENFVVIKDYDLVWVMFAWGKYNQDVFISYCGDNDIDFSKVRGILIDPCGGMDDIIIWKIRCVGDPDTRFNEDPLRILRAVRFQNNFNFSTHYDIEATSFDYEKYTRDSMKKNYFLIKYLSKERVHEEIIKSFSWNNPFAYVAVLDELNLLKYIFPSVYNIKWLEQPVRYHPFDVYSHTMLALYHLQQINQDPLVRLAMLYHDVGKVEQYYSHSLNLKDQDRPFIYWSWLNHTNCGVDMVKEDFTKIWFGNKEIDAISWYVAMHMKPWEILMSSSDNQPKKIRALLSESDLARCNNLLDICMWDRSWHYNPIQKPELEWVVKLRTMLQDLYDAEWQMTISDMKINWDDIMNYFGIQAGPEVGKYIRKVRDRVLEDPENRNSRKKIFVYLDKVKLQ